ncbi:hypothetical protein AgCh_000308 [Apium graveolens]
MLCLSHDKKVAEKELIDFIRKDIEEVVVDVYGDKWPRPAHYRAAYFDIWEKKCPADFTFNGLKSVNLLYITRDNMEFVKFVLGRSPLLEVISISLYGDGMELVNEKCSVFDELLHKLK